MKQTIYIIIALAAIVLGSCKQKEWTEWKTQNEIFLQENAKKDSVKTLPNGVQYKILYAGNPTATKPSNYSTVVCTYTAKLINGIVFDDQINASLSLSSTIDGFASGIKQIHKTGDIIIYVPWQLGYGNNGSGTEGYSSYIPPYSTLIFRVHLSEITN